MIVSGCMKIKKIFFAVVIALTGMSSVQSASADGSYISGGFGEGCSIAMNNPIRCNNGKLLSCFANLGSDAKSQCIETIKGCNAMVRCETFDSNGRKTSSYVDKCY